MPELDAVTAGRPAGASSLEMLRSVSFADTISPTTLDLEKTLLVVAVDGVAVGAMTELAVER